MRGVDILFVILVALLVLGGALLRMRQTNGSSRVATWLVLTVLTMTCEFVVAFIVVHVLLFLFAEGAATVGLVISVVVLAATPVVWAVVIARRGRRSTAHG